MINTTSQCQMLNVPMIYLQNISFALIL